MSSTSPFSRDGLPDSEIARLRLSIQGLGVRRFERAEQVVGWLGAMQAQEYAVAKWSVGQRSTGLDETAVDEALATGSILRTHILRPTWHFVRPEDIRWLLSVTAPRIRAMMRSYDRKLELDDALYARSNDVIARAVEGDNHRTRKELSDELARAGIIASGQRLGHVVMRAELDAVICSGIPRGKQTSYALVAERAPHALVLEPDQALAELARRYFTSHGPATLKDLRWWASLTAAEAKRAVQMVASELKTWTVGTRTYWLAPAAPFPDSPSGTAHLLQGYDESIVGYTESRMVMDVEGLARTVPGQIPFYHVIVLDGQVVARWRRVLRGAGMIIEAKFLRKLNRSERGAVDNAVERYSRFAGLPAELVA